MAYNLIDKLHTDVLKIVDHYNLNFDSKKHTLEYLVLKFKNDMKTLLPGIKYLLSRGYGINIKAMCIAVNSNNLELVKFLTSNVTSHFHKYVNHLFFLSCCNGNLFLAEYFVSEGAVIKDKIKRALRTASKNGHLNIIKYLFPHIDIASNNIARSMFLIATKKGNLDILEYIYPFVQRPQLLKGIEDAALHGHLKVIKFLVEHGHMICAQAITNACRGDHLETVKYMVGQFNWYACKTIPASLLRNKCCNIEMLELIVDYNPPSVKSVYNACMYGQLEILRYLDFRGLDVYSESNMEVALLHNQYNIINFFVNREFTSSKNIMDVYLKTKNLSGIDYFLNKPKFQWPNDFSVLVEATQRNCLNIVRYFFKHFNYTDIEKQQLLRVAIVNGNYNILRYLVEDQCVDLNVKNEWAREWAATTTDFRILNYIASQLYCGKSI